MGGRQLQLEIGERGQFFGWQVLMLLFTRMIVGPVKGIERIINRWGKGDRNEMDGMQLFAEIQRLQPGMPVIILTFHGFIMDRAAPEKRCGPRRSITPARAVAGV